MAMAIQPQGSVGGIGRVGQEFVKCPYPRPSFIHLGFKRPAFERSLAAGPIVGSGTLGNETMKKKIAAVAALATLALTLSACLIVNVERPDKDGKPDHHAQAGQST
jgi:hypothetical protein